MYKKRLTINNFITIFLIVYPLFAFSFIKSIGSPTINNIKGNNLVYIIPLFFSLKFLLIKKRKTNIKMLSLILCYLIYLTLELFFNYNEQSLYSVLYIILPILLISVVNEDDGIKFNKLLIIIIFLSIIYSLLVILEFLFYNTIAGYLGLNTVADYVTRHSTILGSSITTSYYLLMSIPMCFIGLGVFNKKMKKVSIFAILLIVFSIIICQSRICFITLGIYTILYLFLFGKNIKLYKKILIIFAICLLFMWVLNNESLSRLYSNYSDGASSQLRFNILKNGINTFFRKPIFGSGIATFYKRLWTVNFRTIMIYGNVSLVDPHNLYVYLLVEQGLVGLIMYFSIFLIMCKEYINYLPKYIRINTYIMIVGMIIVFCGGSQLMNEISFSLVFYSYFMLLCSKGLYERKKKNEENIICCL